tara:strand:- start:516 stop:1193 length:678 start_codon:yes stop_codon:yes gene_type:complete
MKLSMEQAAVVIGKSKKTIYNHKDKNKFSYDFDEDGKAVIDASELIRVYGNKPDIAQRLKELQQPTNENESVSTQDYTKKTKASVKESEIVDYKIKLARLEAELDKEKTIKVKVEEDLEYFKEALEKSQETAQKVTFLLEDQRSKTQNHDEDWKKSIQALEEKIANQEKSAKEQAEEEAKQKELLLAEKKDLSKANKIYAGLALIALLGVIATTVIQSGIIKISF